MTIHPARRVRTLRLKAPSESLARRGAILVEDALSTASMRDPDARVLLIIRSLDIGVIRGHQSQASVALKIEEALRHLGASAIHAETIGAESRPAVYFRDRLEACACLARRIARQERTDAWFWPLAVKSWRSGMPRHEALRTLLSEALQTETGAAAGATMMRELYASGAADHILAALGRQDGVALLRLSGLPEGAALSLPLTLVEPLPPDSAREPADQWTPLLWKWIERWGADDARSLWLAATTLIAENPGRLLDPLLALRARRLIRFVTTLRAPALFSDAQQPADQIAPQALANPRGEEKMETLEHRPTTGMRNRGLRSEPGEGEETKIEIGALAQAESDDRAIGAPSVEATGESKPQPDTTREPEYPRPTEYAGLLFLLPVMTRLGVAEWLEANPELIEIDFPHRLLRRVARLFGAPDGDPIFASFGERGLMEPPRRCEFVVPSRWLNGVASEPLRLRRIERGERESDRTRALSDKTGLMTLALWRGRATLAVREFITARAVKRGRILRYEEGDTDLLLNTWITAMRRWLRRYAGVGLREVARRPGRVSVTRSHVDLLFDLNQADARIRKVGLDLNPGWLPWFGRVVTFHYLAGERIYES